MTFRKSMTILGLAAFAAAGLSAADQPFDGGFALTMGKGMSLKHEVTGKDLGAIVEFGYTGQIANSGVPFRAGLSYGVFPSQEINNNDFVYGQHKSKSDLKGLQFSADVMQETGLEGLRVVVGLSLNKWSYSRTLTTLPDGVVQYDESDVAKGIKFGARIGLEYKVTKQISANLLMQVTELATDNLATKSINPSWLQVGVRYHF